MPNMVQTVAEAWQKLLKNRRLCITIMIGLAVIVALSTIYALVLPAQSMERTLICDKEVHTHTDECYQEVFIEDSRELICTDESEDHEHTDDCYKISGQTEKKLICGKEEHQHTDECYVDLPTTATEYKCNMDEHTHGDGCYDAEGKLICTIPEHQHSDACLEKADTKDDAKSGKVTEDNANDESETKTVKKSALMKSAPLMSGVSLMASDDSATYWKKVTGIDELTEDDVYIIVDKTNGIALYGNNINTTTKANFQEVSGKDGYYTTSLGNEYYWKLSNVSSSSSDKTAKIKNVNTGKGLNLGNPLTVNNSSQTTDTLKYSTSNSAWIISATSSSGWSTTTRYLNYESGSSWGSSYSRFTTTTSSNSSGNNMLIYKQVENPDPGGEDDPVIPPVGPGGSDTGITKPTYPADKAVSGSKTGDTAVDTVQGHYYSDPSTSQLESKFNGNPADDGKVLTDKSVVYGKDDYGAFSNYPANTFGVTLSALAQTYELTANVSAPIDVVFVVDTSGSMIDTAYNGTNSATETVKALNKAMKMVMDANPDNRMGVVSFSNDSHKILELGRYTATNNKYFPESGYMVLQSNGVDYSHRVDFKPSDSLAYEPGYKSGTPYKGVANQWFGTYTQKGIAEGAQELIDATDKQVDVVVDIDAGDGRIIKKTVTMTRRPVIILLSDGEPTFCNENYSTVLQHDNTIHGSGSDGYASDRWPARDGLREGDYYSPVKNWGNYKGSGYYVDLSNFTNTYPPDYNAGTYIRVNNPKGVMGYYTILSANSYKDQVAKAYGTDTYFYTIGLGINPGSKDSIARSISSDIYKTAVLNPTAENISRLSTKSGQTTTDMAYTRDRDISPYTEETSTMLQQLLNNNATPSTNQWIKRSGSQNVVYVEQLTDPNGITQMGSPQATSGTVPIIANPYAGNYQYNDGATFSNNPSADDLAAIYRSAIESAGKSSVYGFILKENKPATISDTIGDGMEMKTEPVLNYGGVNNQPVSHETVNGKTVYHYSGTYVPKDANGNPDGSGTAIDLSKITAVVETDANGNQVVSMNIPEEAMPTYKQYVDADGNVKFYYEDLPARLIYQVGLTQESENEVKALAKTGGEKTYYTNKDADSEFMPVGSTNPYYKGNNYDRDPLVKTENTTDTKDNAWTYDPSSNASDVKEDLGNNGKLVFSADIPKVDITLQKVSETNVAITNNSASFELYSDESLKNKVGSYTTNENGVLTISQLTVGETYYLVETKAPDGFNKLEGAIKIKVNGVNDIQILNMNEYAQYSDNVLRVMNVSGYELPETGGIGTFILYTLGGLLSAGALMYGYFLRRKKERGTY